jgi:sigma-B regulation protein RsbU (phosphoserine phosphatase)
VAAQLNFPIYSLLVIPLKPQQKSLGVLALANRRDASIFTQDDIALMMTIAREGSLAIDNFDLRDELREKVRMEEELRVARTIQESFYPAVLPALPGWEWSAKALPARVVGGDFYWGASPREGLVDLAIGDVSGKGIPAALYMAKLLSILQAEARADRSPADIMAAINQRLTEGTYTGMFASVIFVRIEGEPLTWSSAGHPPPLLIRPTSYIVEKLQASNRALGLTKDSPYENLPLRLAAGETLVLYTDGLFETANPGGERFGLPRLQTAAAKTKGQPPQALIESLIKEVTVFAPGDLQDDLTALVIRKT